MPSLDFLEKLKLQTEEMQTKGVRRLLVFSGDKAWCSGSSKLCQSALPGDWPTISESNDLALARPPSAARGLLGQEYRHGIFDAREGFHAEAFAILAGTLVAGSWLLLLVPDWPSWETHPDRDTLRWHSTEHPFPTPNFVLYFKQKILEDPLVALYKQGQNPTCESLPPLPDWKQEEASHQQYQILHQLMQAPPGIHVVKAARGRGKSALAGMLVNRWKGHCIVTAPAKNAVGVLKNFAGGSCHFIAPDALLKLSDTQHIDWLLIDEAAAIPTPLLKSLLQRFCRILLTTTTQGYEGTGRGFQLKFCAALPCANYYHLDAPLRWQHNDPLEKFVDESILLPKQKTRPLPIPIAFRRLYQCEWGRGSARLITLYQLLIDAHYRTTPLDLRRMMDAPGQHFIGAESGDGQLSAAIWLVDEGGLDPKLTQQIWSGERRPRGNLVAQSLVAHAGFPEAAQMQSRRVSRIAITEEHRRKGIGTRLIHKAKLEAQGKDYLSVSFGFETTLWIFWKKLEFKLIKIGTKREASSGCYSAIAIMPLSKIGHQFAQNAEQKFLRSLYWINPIISEKIPINSLALKLQQTLTEEDWQDLAGFAYAHRPFEASIPSLGRLLLASDKPALALRARILQNRSTAWIINELQLSGKSDLLRRWRQEATALMHSISAYFFSK